MTPNPHDVAAAQLHAAAARARLFGTLGQVQQRLKPANLAQDAVDSATEGMATAARSAADAVKARPFASAAVAGGIGLFLARGWIFDRLRRRASDDETPSHPEGLNSKQPPAKTAKKGQPK